MPPGLVNGGLAVFRLRAHIQTFFGCQEPAERLPGFRAVVGNQDSFIHRARPFMQAKFYKNRFAASNVYSAWELCGAGEYRARICTPPAPGPRDSGLSAD